MPDVVAVFDTALNIQFLNPAAFEFLAMAPGQVIGKPLDEVCPPEILPVVKSMLSKACERAAFQEGEVSGVLADGTPYTAALQVVSIGGDEGVSQLLLVSHDISSTKQAESQRESYLQRLDTLLNVSLDLLGVEQIEPLLEGLVAAAQRLTKAKLGMTSYLGANNEWVLGPVRRAEDILPCLPKRRFKEMRAGIYKKLLTDTPTLRLTDEEMRRHPLWWGLPKGHVPLRGFLGTRMINGAGKTIGLISLSDKEGGEEFTAEDETLIRHLGALASLALQHIEARQQIEERAEQAEQARKKLEQLTDTLARSAAEVAQSNKDLEQFAYIASHDLQEPLRMVTGFLKLLSQQYQGRLEKEADEYIAYAVEGASRMQTLISGLLAYSRIGSRGMPFAETDLEAVVDQVLKVMSGPLSESRATIKRDPLPRVVADETQLVQLYQNLIANSIKFRGKTKPEIHIGAACENNRWVFWVRDNGVGFPQSQADRAFLIFQRLHRREESSGSGIGLAICKRVIERHSGRIWAESSPGQGTTFYFTLNA